ncbi:MAG: hypothetical protein AAB388_03255 [Patescibacteria group bacterium]
MTEEIFLAKTKNGFNVVYDSEHSHAATHFASTPSLLGLVKEALQMTDVSAQNIRFEVDMGQIVGETDLVETTSADEIVYALRPFRDRYSRFVKDRRPEPTTYITIELKKQEDGTYLLYTAYIGRLVPSFPGGNVMPEKSREFWSHHALVWGRQGIVPGTETTECPW